MLLTRSKILGVVGFLALSQLNPSHGQTIPEVATDSAGSCGIEDVSPKTARQQREEARNAVVALFARSDDPAPGGDCFSDPAVLLPLFRLGKLTVIDVRPQVQYEKLRIPASLSIPLRELKTLPARALTQTRVVLVNDGRRYAELLSECRRQRSMGRRNVSILSGGLRRWHSIGGDVKGQVLSLSQPAAIHLNDFVADRAFEWEIVLDPGLADLKGLFLGRSVLTTELSQSIRLGTETIATAVPRRRLYLGDVERSRLAVGLSDYDLFVLPDPEVAIERYIDETATISLARRSAGLIKTACAKGLR